MSSVKRAFQYASLSTLGAGKKLLNGKLFGQAVDRAIAQKMSGMKGVPLKISQILGMSEQDSSQIYRQAIADLEAMPMETVKEILENESPGLIDGSQIEEEFHCASLGQVCHLVKDHQDLAVKLQYPDSAENMRLDGKAMKLVTKSFQNFSNGFDMSEYDKVFKNELKQELDYKRELEMQHEFYRIFSDNKDIIIPLSMRKYSSSKCLVMSWEPSVPLSEFLSLASESQKKEASKLFVEFYLTSIFKFGLLHTDPNLGNFGFRVFGEKVQLVVYDFGSVVKLDESKHKVLLSLFDRCLKNIDPFPALVSLGFKDDLLKPIRDKLPVLTSILLQPFLSKGIFSFDTWNRKEKVNDVLGEQRWNFMAAAPAELFLFMRSIYGLFYYTEKLSGGIYCRPKVEDVLLLNHAPILELEKQYASRFIEKEIETSSHLIISVKEFGSQKVKLTLPATSIDNLKNFIPSDVNSKLVKQEIDIDTLVSEVRKNAYRPQTVFSLLEDTKEVSVYLE